jgi:LuxR family maltose regulon positive regulatory protein
MAAEEVDALPLNEATKAIILTKDAAFLHLQCRYEEALKSLDKALCYSVGSNAYLAFFALSIKAQVLEDIGSLNKCGPIYREMLEDLSAADGVSMLKSSYYIGITGVYLKQMDLKAAEAALTTACGYLTDEVLSVDRGYKYNLAEYKLIAGQTREGVRLTYELLEMESYKNTVQLARLLKYLLLSGEMTDELLQSYVNDYAGTPEKFRTLDSRLLYAYILYINGDNGAAQALTDEILKCSRKGGIKLKIIEAELFKIRMLTDQTGDRREVANLIKEALLYSCDDRILLPYYAEHETVRETIRHYEPEISSDLTADEKKHLREILALGKSSVGNLLSERETEVLKELAAGASNKGIALQLCISVATVKTHIINIYSKLQVNNRVAAADSAREMGIL